MKLVRKSSCPCRISKSWMMVEFFHSIVDNTVQKHVKENLVSFSRCKNITDFLAMKRLLFNRPRRFSAKFIEIEIIDIKNLEEMLSCFYRQNINHSHKIPIKFIPLPLCIGSEVLVFIYSTHPCVVPGVIDDVRCKQYDYKVRLNTELHVDGGAKQFVKYVGINSSNVMPLSKLRYIPTPSINYINKEYIIGFENRLIKKLARFNKYEDFKTTRPQLIFDQIKMSKLMNQKQDLILRIARLNDLSEIESIFGKCIRFSVLVDYSTNLLTLFEVDQRLKALVKRSQNFENKNNTTRSELSLFISSTPSEFHQLIKSLPMNIKNLIIILLSYISVSKYDEKTRMLKIGTITQSLLAILPTKYFRHAYKLESCIRSIFMD